MADKTLKSLNFGGADNYFPLPLVTAADNDKILSVVNGEWAAVEAPSGGGGSGQYVWSKHETENGKILEYVIGDTEADYPDGGWSDGFWYKLKLAITPYLSFIGNEDFTLETLDSYKSWDGTLEYSTDKLNWTTWSGAKISSSGSKLYLRGTGNTKITGPWANRFSFTGTDALKIACEGNIENLLDYETVSAGGHPTMASKCYDSMFFGCTSLTTAPELPATKLTERCYAYMFQGCTSLTTAPALPATTLANDCYNGMLENCTALTTAPALPATTLASSCYRYMFYGCTSLTTAPALPATTLTERCYQSMFQGCTSLTTAPELPATTLADYCYNGMFYGCTSLTTAPALPATTLAESCYGYMFNGCTKIKMSTTKTGEYQTAYRIPISGTGSDELGALDDIFANTGGTFTGTPSINTTYYTSNTVV